MAKTIVRTRFRVADQACLDCCGDIGAAIQQLPGIKTVRVLTASNVILIDHDERTSADAIERQAASCSVKLAPADARPSEVHQSWWREPRLIALAIAGILLLLGIVAEKFAQADALAIAAYLMTLAIGGFYPAKNALRSLRRRRLTITTLVVVAAAGAVALRVYEEAALLVVVYSLGEVLEAYASDRARGAIRKLMALVPPIAQREKAAGGLESVPVEMLAPGDVVVVRPGERLPTDGEIVAGISAIDQSPVTGESMPVEVSRGSSVFGGTVNGTGALKVRVTKEYADTTLARIIRQVQEAQASKGQAERFADRFGAVYTPAMFAVAAVVAVVPPLVAGDFQEWFYRALVVLTVSCSYALVMSVPIAIVAAISRAARLGILVKGGVYLERLASIRVAVFDKTGTLTRGRPRVVDVVPMNGFDGDELLRLAASVEVASEHPLAGALVSAADARHLRKSEAMDPRALPGNGVEATVDGRHVFVGRPDQGLPSDVGSVLAGFQAQGKTAVIVSAGDRIAGVLAVADEIRPDAADSIGSLRALGLDHVVMLTGDNEPTAAAIARALGIDNWRAGLLPHEKTAAVVALRQQYGAIVMVGDGINDAPALATADVGVAMGAAGTDIALETADVALMADDLTKLPEAIRLSRRAVANIRQNIALSLATVAVLVIGALAGWLSLTTGLLLNEGSALLIIANGLRLLGTSGESATSTPPTRMQAGLRTS